MAASAKIVVQWNAVQKYGALVDKQRGWTQADPSILSERFALVRPIMNKLLSICGVLAMAAAATALGKDFPLTFRTIPAKDVMSFPGGSGSYGLAGLTKPEKLRKEPKAMSRQPLYGVCRYTPTGLAFLFRLDESKGDGKGYDRLIVDMNQNGDLTDDSVVQRTVLPTDRRTSDTDQMFFGPIQTPADKAVAGGRPVYFAQVYLFNREILTSGQTRQTTEFGQLVLKAGWYLDTTVELNGLKQKVGVYDNDSNLRLGDIARSQTFTNRGGTSWYFRGGDSLLVDADGSGTFENDLFQSESCPFGPILYLGAKAYKVALAPDWKSLHMEPWTEALAEVALQPHGDQIRNVTLAWEQPSGQWQLIRPAVTDGKVMVPPGNYRLYASSLVGKGAPRDQVMVSGTQRVPQTPVSIAAGKANSLDCGAPLDIKVTAVKSRGASRELLGEDAGDAKATSDYVLRINANVAGAGGEVYSTFQKGDGFRTRPPKPSFTIVQAGGKTVASGSLEYG
jgi:hypothetical protein